MPNILRSMLPSNPDDIGGEEHWPLILVGLDRQVIVCSGQRHSQLTDPALDHARHRGDPIGSVPLSNEAGIEWKLGASAQIIDVNVVCIPNHHPETDKLKRGGYTDYELAATADVTYVIQDANPWASMDAKMRFEAVTTGGVVLGSADAAFRIVRGGTSGTASAKIIGVSKEEVQRVMAVRARWLYGGG